MNRELELITRYSKIQYNINLIPFFTVIQSNLKKDQVSVNSMKCALLSLKIQFRFWSLSLATPRGLRQAKNPPTLLVVWATTLDRNFCEAWPGSIDNKSPLSADQSSFSCPIFIMTAYTPSRSVTLWPVLTVMLWKDWDVYATCHCKNERSRVELHHFHLFLESHIPE